MTISRERPTAQATTRGRAQFATPAAAARGDDRREWMLAADVPLPGGGGPPDRLYLLAEPVGQLERGEAVGASVLAAIRDIYGSSERADPVAALTVALDTANLALYQQNLTTTPGRRVILGLTCLVARGEELLICQVPPTQLILSQGGVPITLPDLTSWQRDYQPHARDDRQGLGATEKSAPLLFRATLERGDLITLCTSNLGRALADLAVPGDLGPLLDTDPDAAMTFLAELAETRALPLAYATTISPALGDEAADPDEEADPDGAWDDAPAPVASTARDTAGGEGGWFGRIRQRSRIIPWPRGGRRADAPDDEAVADFAAPDDDTDEFAPDADAERTPPAIATFRVHPADQQADNATEPPDEGWDDEPEDTVSRREWSAAPRAAAGPGDERELVEGDDEEAAPYAARARARRRSPLQSLGSALILPLLVVGTIAERLAPPGGRAKGGGYLERSRNRIWPLGGLERYRAGGLPLGRRLPLLICVAIVALSGLLLFSIRNHQIGAERARFDLALAKVGEARVAAQGSPDRTWAHGQLLALPAQLAAIPAADKIGRPERIAAENAAIALALDQVDGVQRLPTAAVQLVAPFPAAASGGAARPQVVIGGGKPYVLTNGTIYGLDDRRALTKVLAKGDTAGGVGVGAILGIAWRLDSLFAFTETQGFVRDSAGKWSTLPVAASGRKVTAVDSFGGNLYFLEAERGQIVKYASGAYNQQPQPWSGSKTNADLGAATDMAIDTDIYTLLTDGRILDLYQGEIKAILAPAVVPPLAGATALAASPEGKWLYIVDPREGRIVRLGRDGGQIAVYKPEAGAKSLVGAREIATDEATNTAYLVTDEGLLSVRLP